MIGYIYVHCSLVLVFLYLQIFPPHCFPLVLFRVSFRIGLGLVLSFGLIVVYSAGQKYHWQIIWSWSLLFTLVLAIVVSLAN